MNADQKKDVETGEPMQPLVVSPDGKVRFRANALVRYLLDEGPFDMNALAAVDCTPEDRMQFAQLIGYSVGGYGELSYVTDESYERAEKAANALRTPLDSPKASSPQTSGRESARLSQIFANYESMGIVEKLRCLRRYADEPGTGGNVVLVRSELDAILEALVASSKQEGE